MDKVEETLPPFPDSTTEPAPRLIHQMYNEGDAVFYHDDDGAWVFGEVGQVSSTSLSCQILFGDGTEQWTSFKRIKKLMAEESNNAHNMDGCSSNSIGDKDSSCIIGKDSQAQSPVKGSSTKTTNSSSSSSGHNHSTTPTPTLIKPRPILTELTCNSCGAVKRITSKKASLYSNAAATNRPSFQCRKCCKESLGIGPEVKIGGIINQEKFNQLLPANPPTMQHIPSQSNSTLCFICSKQTVSYSRVHCELCKEPCHLMCLGLNPGPLDGDIFWLLLCTACGRQSKTLPRSEKLKIFSVRRELNGWEDIADLIISCLSVKFGDKKMFYFEDDMMEFLRDELVGERLHLPGKYKNIEPEYRSKYILNALKKSVSRFINGLEIKQSSDLWGLRRSYIEKKVNVYQTAVKFGLKRRIIREGKGIEKNDDKVNTEKREKIIIKTESKNLEMNDLNSTKTSYVKRKDRDKDFFNINNPAKKRRIDQFHSAKLVPETKKGVQLSGSKNDCPNKSDFNIKNNHHVNDDSDSDSLSSQHSESQSNTQNSLLQRKTPLKILHRVAVKSPMKIQKSSDEDDSSDSDSSTNSNTTSSSSNASVPKSSTKTRLGIGISHAIKSTNKVPLNRIQFEIGIEGGELKNDDEDDKDMNVVTAPLRGRPSKKKINVHLSDKDKSNSQIVQKQRLRERSKVESFCENKVGSNAQILAAGKIKKKIIIKKKHGKGKNSKPVQWSNSPICFKCGDELDGSDKNDDKFSPSIYTASLYPGYTIHCLPKSNPNDRINALQVISNLREETESNLASLLLKHNGNEISTRSETKRKSDFYYNIKKRDLSDYNSYDVIGKMVDAFGVERYCVKWREDKGCSYFDIGWEEYLMKNFKWNNCNSDDDMESSIGSPSSNSSSIGFPVIIDMI